MIVILNNGLGFESGVLRCFLVGLIFLDHGAIFIITVTFYDQGGAFKESVAFSRSGPKFLYHDLRF